MLLNLLNHNTAPDNDFVINHNFERLFFQHDSISENLVQFKEPFFGRKIIIYDMELMSLT